MHGYNYEYDKTAVDFLFQSGIDIDIISTLNSEFVIFDHGFINQCRKGETTLAKALLNFNKKSDRYEKPGRGEELAAIYIANPELFEMSPMDEHKMVNVNKKQNIHAISLILPFLQPPELVFKISFNIDDDVLKVLITGNNSK
ncbi:MAG: hypothetical protein NT144_07430 [Bacteroidia bacterium]|nr:hypothetical protein [Bacteroidia bacterium]